MTSTTLSIIFVIGSPGSGKGTLCKRLAEEHEFSHISTGDLLRSIISSSNSDLIVVNSVKNGDLVPVEALAPILNSVIEREKLNGRKKILMDGFPRRLDQAAQVEAIIGSPALVLFFNCPEEKAEKRFLTRKLTGRETDDASLFQKRYQEFTKLNPDIIEAYRQRGILLEIDTSGETEVSYRNLVMALDDTDESRL